ncbi:MAG: TolC family protein [Acidobacteriota bacterium]|nr:TolC family protein [Acidobacteriota bacterium]
MPRALSLCALGAASVCIHAQQATPFPSAPEVSTAAQLPFQMQEQTGSLHQSSSTASAQPVVAGASTPTPVVTLEQAVALARANEPGFAAASAAARVSQLDRSIARAALLPGAVYHNNFLYTQPAEASTGSGNASVGSPAITSTPRFIANNAVHEYTSQGSVTETIGLAQLTAVARASAAAAVASAELEIARRGLVSTVVSLYYGSLAADRKLAVTQRAAREADSFTTLTQQREVAREAAHADVVKAQLQQQQRARDLADAQLQQQRARLELGVLLYPDPRQPFSLTPAPAPAELPGQAQIETAARGHNPELMSAAASLQVDTLNVRAARAAYLPDLGLNVAYGIDAAQFAARGPDGVHNLGYSASATLDIPIWDWLSTQHRIRQAEILRNAAKVTLTFAQRRLVAQLEEFYAEAATARDQLASLGLSVRTAEESLHLTRLRYTAGEATVLEVVDAQNSLTTAELAREDGTVRYEVALANLQLLTGTMQP